jgi:hypothetical protein
VIIHAEPTQTSARLGWVAEGATPSRDCAVFGDYVGDVRVWFRVADAGVSGYIPSYYDDSHYQTMAELTAKYGIPECASQGLDASSPAADAPLNPSYYRTAGVEWAVAHAQDDQGSGTLCTWFVSNALWAGGLPTSEAWQKGTRSSVYVTDLRDYLVDNGIASWSDITANLTTNAVPGADIGDVIVYDWEGDGELDHMAYVVDITADQYPEVAEHGQFDFTKNPWFKLSTPRSPYIERGWTYSELNHQWLQAEEGNSSMRVHLLHINGGYIGPTF